MSPELALPVRRPRTAEPDVPAWLLDPAPAPSARSAAPAPSARSAAPAPGAHPVAGPEAPARPQPAPRRPVVPAPRRPPQEPAGPTLDDYVLPPLPVAPEPVREPRLRFRPDVEGLRGVAVLLVVLHHAGVALLPGGFVGVDVFFVLSGYLVTALMVAEVRREGGVGLLAFYARRSRRILPAVGVVLVVTCLLGAVLLPPTARLALARDVLAAALLGGTWQPGPETAAGYPAPVLHLGALGAGEQLAVLWPLLFVAALLVARRLRLARTTVLAVVLTVVTVASFAVAARADAGPAGPVAAARGWQLAAGAWLALLLPVAALHRGRLADAVRALLGLVGLTALGGLALTARDAGPATALAATLATAAVLAAGRPGRTARGRVAGPVPLLLGARPLRRLGAVAFTWYLWHWPLVTLAAARGGEVTWPAGLAASLVALGLAALTTAWVERPLRRDPVVVSRPRAGLALGVAAVVLPVCAALVLATLTARSLGVDGPVFEEAGRVDRQVVRFDDTRTSGRTTPTAAQALAERPDVPQDCRPDDARPQCLRGTVGAAGPVVLLGDDRATQWLPAVEALAADAGTAVRVLTRTGCPVVAPTGPGDFAAQRADGCEAWRATALQGLANGPRPALVVVSSDDATSSPAQWSRTLDRLVAVGAPVVYLADTPHPGFDVPGCVAGAADDWSRCAFPRAETLPDDPTAQAVASGRVPGVHLVDLSALLCPRALSAQGCPAVRGGVLLYRDDAHLTEHAARVLAPQLVAAVRGQLGGLATG